MCHYIASSVSKQDDMDQERERWGYLARSGLPAVSRENILFSVPYNESFIEQASRVKMVRYWPFLLDYVPGLLLSP